MPPGNTILSQEVSYLLAKQNTNNLFNRYDVIVIYLAIEEYFGLNKIGFDLYRKMQSQRSIYRSGKVKQKDYVGGLRKLIHSVDKNGFENRSTITIDNKLKLCDGAHRFACALYFNVGTVPVRMFRTEKHIHYGIDFFTKYGFSARQIDSLERKRLEISRSKGLLNPVIISMEYSENRLLIDMYNELKNSYGQCAEEFRLKDDHFYDELLSLLSGNEIMSGHVSTMKAKSSGTGIIFYIDYSDLEVKYSYTNHSYTYKQKDKQIDKFLNKALESGCVYGMNSAQISGLNALIDRLLIRSKINTFS